MAPAWQAVLSHRSCHHLGGSKLNPKAYGLDVLPARAFCASTNCVEPVSHSNIVSVSNVSFLIDLIS